MGEKVTNGTFESWSSATDVDNWTESITGSSTVNRESSEQYAGTYCLRFDVDSSRNSARVAQSITLVGDAAYIFSFWYKSSVGSGDLLHMVLSSQDDGYTLDNSSGDWSAPANQDDILVVATTSWTKFFGTFIASHGNGYTLSIQSCVHGLGITSESVYIDNVSIDDTLIDHETESIELADAGGSGRQTVYDSVSVKDDFKYYLASSTGKVFEYSEDYLSDDGSVIVCRWRSKTLDFADQIPACLDSFKELTGVKLIYKDLSSSTEVTIYVSTDGGQTWEHETKSLGTGTNEILSANYHFIKTGEYFILAIEHVSTDKKFLWLHMEADVVPLGPYVEI